MARRHQRAPPCSAAARVPRSVALAAVAAAALGLGFAVAEAARRVPLQQEQQAQLAMPHGDRAATPDGKFLPCDSFTGTALEAAILWGVVDPRACARAAPWPSPSARSPSSSSSSPSSLAPLATAASDPPMPPPVPLPPRREPTSPPQPGPVPPPQPQPQPSQAPLSPPPPPPPQPQLAPIPQPTPPPPAAAPPTPKAGPAPHAPARPSPAASSKGPAPPPPVGKVTCIPGDTCRTARFSCELDTICNEWGQCPPSAPVPREDDFICRESAGECDQEELCDGIGLKCPPDAFLPPGSPCTDINGDDSACLGGKPEKAADPYELAGPGGRGRRGLRGAGRRRRLAAGAAAAEAAAQPGQGEGASSSGARRYKYNPRVCPLSSWAPAGDDDLSGGRNGGKRGRLLF